MFSYTQNIHSQKFMKTQIRSQTVVTVMTVNPGLFKKRHVPTGHVRSTNCRRDRRWVTYGLRVVGGWEVTLLAVTEVCNGL